MEECNAKVDSTWLGYEDHNIPSFSIGLSMGAGHQGYGGYDLRCYNWAKWMSAILDIFEVRKWENLVGQPCKVRRDGGMIVAIGNLMEDEWLTKKDISSFELPKEDN